VWETLAANITAGTASFYIFAVGSDTGTGAATGTNYRLMGTIGTDMSFDMMVPSTALTTAANFGPISSFGVQMPLAA
jgi:hypothetical protein